MADFDPDRLLTEPAPESATMRIRPPSKTMQEILTKIKGGESGGRYDVMYGGERFDPNKGHPRKAVPITEGPNKGKTSSAAGAYQFIGSTWDKVAAKTGLHDMSKASQDINAATLAADTYKKQTGRDIEADWAEGSPKLRQAIQQALSSEWESLGKPGPRMDKLDADGKPRFRFSDYAMQEHEGKPNTNVLMMAPQQYLDLSPELNGKPFENASGRSLMRSFNRGEPMESIPTMDVKMDGSTATVTDQDGRHRALLAQQQGVDAIPVAMRQTGDGKPTEIVGASGVPMAHDFPTPAEARQPRQEQPEAPHQTFSLIPGAQAAEPTRNAAGEPVDANPYAQFTGAAPAGAPAGGAAADNPYAQFTGGAAPEQQQGEPDSLIGSAVRGASKGFGDTVFSGQELIGKGMQAIGIPGGGALTQDARDRMAAEAQKSAPDEAAHPWATGIGDFLGGMAVPGGVAGKLIKPANKLRQAAAAGALASALTPEGDDNFWTNKALQTGAGAGAGVAAGAVGNALSKMIAPTLRATVGKLMNEGVELTAGQMAGGATKRAEDAMASIPILGSTIRKAQRRSIETFNRAAINRSLEDIGVKLPQGTSAGHDAIGFAQDEFGKAYDAVIPNMRGRVDTDFRTDLNDIVDKARRENLPEQYIDQLQHVITREVIEPFRLGQGTITGKSAQNIGTKLDELINPLKRGGVYEQQLGGYLREADNAIDGLMGRQNQALMADKQRIDAGYAKFKTVQNAATSLGAKDGVFTPFQLSRAIKGRDRSKDKAAFARGDAMMQDLATAARDVLPQTVPDSGTPERALLMGMIGGAAHIEPHTAAALAGLAVPYTAPASRALNAAVNRLAQPAGPARNALAEIARNAGRVAAPGLGSVAAGLVPGQQ